MNVADILTEVDDHGFSERTSAQKMRLLNAIYHDVNSQASWPYLESEATVNFVAGTATPSSGWPTDFSKLLTLTCAADDKTLEPIRKDELYKVNPGGLTERGTPAFYYWTADTLSVWPVPDADRVMTLTYICFDADLASDDVEADILLPPRHHEVLVLGLLSRMYLLDDDLEMGDYFKKLYDEKIARMTEDLQRRQFDRPDTVLDTDPYSYDYD